MALLKKIFVVNTKPRSWYLVILWWEFRRLIYNAFLVLFAALMIAICLVIPGEGYIKLYPGAMLTIWFLTITAAYLIIANICYTGGWIFQLLTRHVTNAKMVKITKSLFVIGLIFSFVVTLLPCVLVWLNIVLPTELIDYFYTKGIRIFEFVIHM